MGSAWPAFFIAASLLMLEREDASPDCASGDPVIWLRARYGKPKGNLETVSHGAPAATDAASAHPAAGGEHHGRLRTSGRRQVSP
jgi:hypothetical protein